MKLKKEGKLRGNLNLLGICHYFICSLTNTTNRYPPCQTGKEDICTLQSCLYCNFNITLIGTETQMDYHYKLYLCILSLYCYLWLFVVIYSQHTSALTLGQGRRRKWDMTELSIMVEHPH